MTHQLAERKPEFADRLIISYSNGSFELRVISCHCNGKVTRSYITSDIKLSLEPNIDEAIDLTNFINRSIQTTEVKSVDVRIKPQSSRAFEDALQRESLSERVKEEVIKPSLFSSSF